MYCNVYSVLMTGHLPQAGLVAYYTGVVNMKKLHYYAMQLYSQIEHETGQVRRYLPLLCAQVCIIVLYMKCFNQAESRHFICSGDFCGELRFGVKGTFVNVVSFFDCRGVDF